MSKLCGFAGTLGFGVVAWLRHNRQESAQEDSILGDSPEDIGWRILIAMRDGSWDPKTKEEAEAEAKQAVDTFLTWQANYDAALEENMALADPDVVGEKSWQGFLSAAAKTDTAAEDYPNAQIGYPWSDASAHSEPWSTLAEHPCVSAGGAEPSVRSLYVPFCSLLLPTAEGRWDFIRAGCAPGRLSPGQLRSIPLLLAYLWAIQGTAWDFAPVPSV
ncbi:MAG: hypothetical protein LBJ38_02085 [Oscillospiraceae bacterium]|nr:hypothetical protein [Oscillospiraceae bacterium]